MPWQQQVSDVALEVDPVTKRLVYREVRLTVPRQSGKTTKILALAVHRALAAQQFGARNRIVYTAQTRKDAKSKFQHDFVEDLKASTALAGRWVERQSNGDENVTFSQSRSMFAIDATTEKSGHGPTVDLGFIDEAFAQVDRRSEQAMKPAMITRKQAQLWIVSTAGWLGGSPYLWEKVESGRALAADQSLWRPGDAYPSGVCYFEWSAPEDCDPADPEVWRACMPALGFTVDEAAIAAEFEAMTLNDFKRAFLNIWVPKDAPADQLIPAVRWGAAEDTASQMGDRFAFAFDMTPERSHGSIAVAGMDGDRTHLEVVDHTGLGGRTGVDWMVDRIVELDALGPVAWVVDAMSPAASLIQALEDKGITVTVTNVQDLVRACGNFFDAATNRVPSIVHLGQPELDAAIKAAKKRVIGDRFAWSRRDPLVPISPLMAVTLAAHGLATAPAPVVSLPPSRATTVRVADSDVMSQRW